jgi:hypothetical protein
MITLYRCNIATNELNRVLQKGDGHDSESIQKAHFKELLES